MDGGQDPERADALEQFKKKLLESREMEAKLKTLRLDIKGLKEEFDTTEDNIKALQSVGQIIGEVLKQLDEERCAYRAVTCRPKNRPQEIANDSTRSHCESFIRSPICCRLPIQS
jgi:ATP-dependent 26S proteasome regulatory subunit